MTDRELLELAAKAAGIWAVAACAFGDSEVVEECRIGLWNRDQGGVWNPLTDDADALRLAVKLRLAITVSHHNETHVEGPPPAEAYAFEKHGDDPCAATRRAIVRAAAAIGEKQ